MNAVSSRLSNAENRKAGRDARLLVAISFHFVEARLVYLGKVLQSLAAFSLSRRDVVVFTNSTNPAEQKSIRQVFQTAGFNDGTDARLVVETGLPHPYNLTWAHKKLISGDFLAPDSPYSHFAYLEDDLQLTFENFAYFLDAREILRPFDLVPAFLRTEWSTQRSCCMNTDNIAPISLSNRPFISHGDIAFIGANNPYNGAFILDQELARKYVRSRSFDLHRSRRASRSVFKFGVRERAAMGVGYENAPAPFRSRLVVPVSISSRQTPPSAWLAHLPNNYADNPNSPFARIPMTDLFAGDLDAGNEVRLSTFRSPGQRLFRLGFRVLERVRTNFSRLESDLNV